MISALQATIFRHKYSRRKVGKPQVKRLLCRETSRGITIWLFIGLRHDRIDTRLNEVPKLCISLEAKNLRLVLREIPLFK